MSFRYSFYPTYISTRKLLDSYRIEPRIRLDCKVSRFYKLDPQPQSIYILNASAPAGAKIMLFFPHIARTGTLLSRIQA